MLSSKVKSHLFRIMSNYNDQLTINCFLMAYSYLEEYLYLLWKHTHPDVPRGRGSSIKRYQPVLEKLNFDIQSETWSLLLEATDVRHCLLHANGRISMMTNPPSSAFRKLVAKRCGELEIKVDRLRLRVDYLQRTVETIRNLQDSVNSTA